MKRTRTKKKKEKEKKEEKEKNKRKEKTKKEIVFGAVPFARGNPCVSFRDREPRNYYLIRLTPRTVYNERSLAGLSRISHVLLRGSAKIYLHNSRFHRENGNKNSSPPPLTPTPPGERGSLFHFTMRSFGSRRDFEMKRLLKTASTVRLALNWL